MTLLFTYSKKKILTKKLGESSLNELSLYHGTCATVIDGICVQNFDWRLNGAHATAYGQGSYFATTSSYSLGYTKPDSNNIRYMFLAKVLAGKYTQVSNDLFELITFYSKFSIPKPYFIFERHFVYHSGLVDTLCSLFLICQIVFDLSVLIDFSKTRFNCATLSLYYLFSFLFF